VTQVVLPGWQALLCRGVQPVKSLRAVSAYSAPIRITESNLVLGFCISSFCMGDEDREWRSRIGRWFSLA